MCLYCYINKIVIVKVFEYYSSKNNIQTYLTRLYIKLFTKTYWLFFGGRPLLLPSVGALV